MLKGATCVDGQWSPPEVPRCYPELHPSIRSDKYLQGDVPFNMNIVVVGWTRDQSKRVILLTAPRLLTAER